MGVLSKIPPVFLGPFCGENVKECQQMSGDLKKSTGYLTSPSGHPKNVTDTRAISSYIAALTSWRIIGPNVGVVDIRSSFTSD